MEVPRGRAALTATAYKAPITVPVDDDTINAASAELSRDLFVAAAAGPRYAEYHKMLGRRALIVDDSTIDEWVRDAFRGSR